MGQAINLDDDEDAPPKYAKHSPDGFVIFSPAAIDLVMRGKISHDEANDFRDEIAEASYDAQKAKEHLLGFEEWVSHPVGGGEYEITHGGETCRFRPIVNGARRRKPGGGHRCTACRQESPQGATMYVPADDDKRRTQGMWGGRRLCTTCVRPELAAAMIGAAVIAERQSDEG